MLKPTLQDPDSTSASPSAAAGFCVRYGVSSPGFSLEGEGELGDEQSKRALNRVAQQRCRARRKQKFTEMEKLVESLQRQLQSFEATKTEVEGLVIENTMLRRLSSQQTACICALRKQLGDILHKDGAPSPILRKRSYEMHLYGFEGCQTLIEEPFALPHVPLPVPQFAVHTTAIQSTPNSVTERVESMDEAGGGAFNKECFSDLLSDTCDLDDDSQLLFQEASF